MNTFVRMLVLSLGIILAGCGTKIEGSLEGAQSANPFASKHPSKGNSVEQSQTNQAGNQPTAQSVPVNAEQFSRSATIPQAGASSYSAVGELNTLYVILSGNSTCNSSQFSAPLAGLVHNSLFDGFVISVMNTGRVTANDNVLFACYETLSQQMQVFDLKYRPQMFPIHESELDGIIINQAQRAARLIVIGHSYGGWKGMKALSSPFLLNQVQAPIQFVTVDPISKINCTNPLMPGCRQAPSDFTDVEFATLNMRTKWLNAVQEPGIILGSDAMPAAHVNLKFTNVNHFTIVNDPRLWQAITQFLFQQ